jgi:uncharacterized membrane protein YcaP (DUF421 family)
MLTSYHTMLEIALRTLTVYLVILVGIRLTGKREVGQMTPFDLTLLLLLSNSVQNAMTGPDTSLVGGIVAAAVLLCMNAIIAFFAGRNRKFRRELEGSATVLIHNGKLIEANMIKEGLTRDDVNRSLREHGIEHMDDVALAVLEVDGAISCLKYDDVAHSSQHPRRLKFLQKHQ